MCSVVLKAYILTGCDVTSTIGTENGALKADPFEYLREFGLTDEQCTEEVLTAEQYLATVLHHSTTGKTFNQLQIEL